MDRNPGLFEVAMKQVLPIVFAALCLLLLPLAADEPKVLPKKLTVEECQKRIDQLANPEPKPKNVCGKTAINPPKGAEAFIRRQRPIKAAYDELSVNVEVALPLLVKHAGDDRFSYVYESGISGFYSCMTVGDACRQIIQYHVEVCRPHVQKPLDNEGRSRSLSFIEECGGVAGWWQPRREMSLMELQLECIEWARSHKRPDYFDDQEWQTSKKALAELAAKIRESKQPLLIKHEVHFVPK